MSLNYCIMENVGSCVFGGLAILGKIVRISQPVLLKF